MKYCDRSTYFFWQKKIIFSDEAHFDLGGYVNKQNCCIWNTRRKPTRTLFGADFGSESYLVNFSSKMSKERPLQSMAIVIGHFWTNFCSINYFPLLTARILLSNKKRNLRKYSVVFLNIFPKKKCFADPLEMKIIRSI